MTYSVGAFGPHAPFTSWLGGIPGAQFGGIAPQFGQSQYGSPFGGMNPALACSTLRGAFNPLQNVFGYGAQQFAPQGLPQFGQPFLPQIAPQFLAQILGQTLASHFLPQIQSQFGQPFAQQSFGSQFGQPFAQQSFGSQFGQPFQPQIGAHISPEILAQIQLAQQGMLGAHNPFTSIPQLQGVPQFQGIPGFGFPQMFSQGISPSSPSVALAA